MRIPSTTSPTIAAVATAMQVLWTVAVESRSGWSIGLGAKSASKPVAAKTAAEPYAVIWWAVCHFSVSPPPPYLSV